MNYNKTIVGGRLTRDATLETTPKGTSVLEFSVASTEKYKDKEETLFLDCAIFGERAEKLAQYMLKGKAVLLDGRLKLERWEKDGVKNSKHSLVVDSVNFV